MILEDIASVLERRWNAVFWTLFLIAAIVFVVQAVLGKLTLDVITGLLIILLGLLSCGEEIKSRKHKSQHSYLERNVNELFQWANKSYDYMRGFKEKHEERFFSLDSRLSKLSKDQEGIAKKMIDIENKINRVIREERDRKAIAESYALVKSVSAQKQEIKTRPSRTKQTPKLSSLNKRQSSAIELIRKKGSITTKEYTEAFGVIRKTAYRDLDEMVRMGLLKRKGKGRATTYVMAF